MALTVEIFFQFVLIYIVSLINYQKNYDIQKPMIATTWKYNFFINIY